MYRGNGYVEIARYNDDPYANHWFEKRLRPRSEGLWRSTDAPMEAATPTREHGSR